MKKVLSILAVAIFSIGLFSCETDTTDQAYETHADGTSSPTDKRQ